MITGVSGDQAVSVSDGGRSNEAVEDGEASSFAFIFGAELAPSAHDFGARWEQSVSGPVIQAVKPSGDLFTAFSRG